MVAATEATRAATAAATAAAAAAAAAKMVLAELGQQISGALRNLQSATIVDEAVRKAVVH